MIGHHWTVSQLVRNDRLNTESGHPEAIWRSAATDPTRTFGRNLDDNFGIPLPFVVWRHFPPSVDFYSIKQALWG
jgi:hypothetical protein